MCGIAGVWGAQDRTAEGVADMLTAMAHRGPDGSGVSAWPGGAFGMVRLALLDLSPRGQQPIWTEDGALGIVFNGEIYNHAEERRRLEERGHRFRTTTDTEVVLRLFAEEGERGFERLRGMFALAIADRRGRGPEAAPDLVLARDPFGMKPLYVADLPGGGLVFASEVRGLVASGAVRAEIDREGLRSFLAHGFVAPTANILRGVRRVAPGTWERWSPGASVRRGHHFRLPPEQPRAETLAEAAHRLRSALEESVRLHSLADAEVGAFLSGGIDSTAVVALSRPHLRRLRTYTLRYPDVPGADEATAAERTAERFDCDHTTVDVTSAEAIASLPRFAADMDHPTVDGLNVWLVSRAAARGVKAAMSGLGGDEWFAGYRVTRTMTGPWAGGALRPWAAAAARAERHLPPGVWRDRLWNVSSHRSPLALWSRMHSVFSITAAGQLCGSPAVWGEQERDLREAVADWTDDWDSESPLTQAQLLDARVYMGGQLLRDADAASMAHSLELRMPLVDVEIARFARTCREEHRLTPQGGKRVLIESVADKLPDWILNQPKRGFALPYEAWLRGAGASLVEETCSPAAVRARGLLDPELTARYVDAWRAGGTAFPRVWGLMVLELWCRSVDDAARRAPRRSAA
jgi:asparagine synthase (glutamine-hydrolysing)